MHAGEWGRLDNCTEAKSTGTQGRNGNISNGISAPAQLAGTHKGERKSGVKVCKSDSCLNTLIQPFEQRVRHCSACMRAEQVIGLEVERTRGVLRLRPFFVPWAGDVPGVHRSLLSTVHAGAAAGRV